MAAMVKVNVKSLNCDVNVLRSLISIFDSQLAHLAVSAPTELGESPGVPNSCGSNGLDAFQLNCARIHIQCFHFFAHPTNPGPDLEALSRLYSLCISIIQTATSMTQLSNFATVCPSFIDRTITLTAFAILKLSRSPLAPHLDLNAGEQAYSDVVQFSKKMSLQNNDLGARAAAIMANLWSSSKVFRRKDGHIDALGLRLRTRLSMSVSFDMFWYWREEFGHMSNPYNGEDSASQSNTQSQPRTPRMSFKRLLLWSLLTSPTEYERSEEIEHARAISASAVAKYAPSVMNSIQQDLANPPPMSLDSFDASDYNVPLMVDQFPDYDWAAGFNFSTGWPSMNMPPLQNAEYNFG